MKSKIAKFSGSDCFFFYCPGCECHHSFSSRWTFNGSREKPTVTPSLLVNAGRECPDHPRCHLFLTDGIIKFLGDCSHALAGQSVPLEEFEWADGYE